LVLSLLVLSLFDVLSAAGVSAFVESLFALVPVEESDFPFCA